MECASKIHDESQVDWFDQNNFDPTQMFIVMITSL